MLPFVSLNAATSTGSGAEKDLEGTFGNHSILQSVTGSPTDWLIELQGSHDGVNWTTLAGLDENNTFHSLVNFPLRYVRANLASFTGGTSPTFSATIASV